MLKIKKLLGLCECKRCYRRSKFVLEVSGTNKKFDMCAKHSKEILEKGEMLSWQYQF